MLFTGISLSRRSLGQNDASLFELRSWNVTNFVIKFVSRAFTCLSIVNCVPKNLVFGLSFTNRNKFHIWYKWHAIFMFDNFTSFNRRSQSLLWKLTCLWFQNPLFTIKSRNSIDCSVDVKGACGISNQAICCFGPWTLIC
jgi:hypothetical protein